MCDLYPTHAQLRITSLSIAPIQTTTGHRIPDLGSCDYSALCNRFVNLLPVLVWWLMVGVCLSVLRRHLHAQVSMLKFAEGVA